MAFGARRSRALILGASAFSMALTFSTAAVTQTADADRTTEQKKLKQAKRKPAQAEQQPAQAPSASVLNANAQTSTAVQSLDTITVAASKTEERAIDALAPVSVVTLEQIQGLQPKRLSDIFYNVPGVTFQERGDDPSTVINIRGLQDFGRVAVVVDGARQNYQRTGHNANGSFFLDPELVGGVDVVRGPTANIYGSGAIGGLVSFRTKDIQDVVRPGERWGVDTTGSYGTNTNRWLGSMFGGVRVNPDVDMFGGAVYRRQDNYKDGNGTEIGNTGNEIAAGLMKLTVRPAAGHEIKFGGIFQDYQYSIGQLNRGPVATAAQRALNQGSSVYESDAKNYTGTITWKYAKPDDMLWDWNATVYGNRTENDQVKTAHTTTTPSAFCGGGFGNNISGCIGDRRGYLLDTVGTDVNNTTRFNVGEWRNALTYGFDVFNDKVRTSDSRGNSNVTTPGGERTVSGGFVQLKNNYSTWLEIVSALRYDRYDLDSATVSTGGDRFSPKVSVGVTPVAGFTPYVSYAEGYRAPSITETLIAGEHATGGGPPLFPCPGGTAGLFCFVPNPGLRPEVGKNKEAGINLKYDSVFTAGDSFRGKFNVFRNDVDDYIDLVGSAPIPPLLIPGFPGVFSQFFQYQNIAHARIEGVEWETLYDAGLWYVGVSGHLIRGKNVQTGVGLATIIPRKVTTTAGVRLLDRRLILAAQWSSFGGNTDIPVGYVPATNYELVNLYLTWNATKDIVFTASIDNLLNQYYRPYAIPGSSADGTTQNDVLWTSPGPGRVYKAGLKIHFGGA